MLTHLFKLIWNKKKQNLLLISEMLISFLVLFAVFTLVVFYYSNYKKPMGFDYENVWVASYNNSLKTTRADSLERFYETLRQNLEAMPLVQQITFTSDNIPLTQYTSQTGVTYNGIHENSVNFYQVDDSYAQVLNLQLLAGRWFTKADAVAKNKPVVINSSLKETLFGSSDAIGKLLGDGEDKNKLRIVGVIREVKAKGDYATPGPATYTRVDTGSYSWLGKILIKVKPGADAAFESRLYKTMANYLKNSNVEIEHLVDKRKSINNFALVPMIVLLIVASFLTINVALGLFGVLWYNINKRKGEIGLRRALGASGTSVSIQLVAESLILATLSLLVGTFFAIQFPLLNVFDLAAGVYLTALVLAVVFIYLLVLVCSLYPGRQAAAIYPAVALHEE
jgi:putative ABC transport system permease protein